MTVIHKERRGDDHGSDDKTTVIHKGRRRDNHRVTQLLLAAWRRYRICYYLGTEYLIPRVRTNHQATP